MRPWSRSSLFHRNLRALASTGGLLASLCAAACSDDGESSEADTGTVAPGPLDGECPLNERVGLFRIVHEPDYSAVDGEIYEAVIPSTIVEQTAAEGGCRLLARENPFCDPACANGEACTHAGTCIPYPERVETGAVTIAGLEVELVMSPRADKRYFDTTLPHPAFSPGGAIKLTSTGGEIGPLELSGRAFAPLELGDDTWRIEAGKPLIVSWAPEVDGEARFYLTINIDQHGLSPSTLVCEGPDSGSFEVPAAIIDALLDAGTSGFPTGHAYRRTVDSIEADPGCVELEVRSHRSATLEVSGHTPCVDEGDCPDGLSCELMTQTCV
ncbi:hypothetical protein ENSA5_47310 [Enhygromyxa salina]|uniref:Lipoprotein n=1 Tax=Enhygromyxa salina TaxID=215803 RepID=A0A2S9XIW8_9BACT|nr:hypothetical protein [Enhygromyxa salina]PRP92818.1 hypothetical protein ENSA5_47310 [Enhygromyxa salina]